MIVIMKSIAKHIYQYNVWKSMSGWHKDEFPNYPINSLSHIQLIYYCSLSKHFIISAKLLRKLAATMIEP